MPGFGRGGPAGFPGGPGSPTPIRPDGRASGAERRPKVTGAALGSSIHEVGTARMSASPKDGVLILTARRTISPTCTCSEATLSLHW